jgi:hypothetical protein
LALSIPISMPAFATQADKPAKEALAAGAGEVAEWLKAAVC